MPVAFSGSRLAILPHCTGCGRCVAACPRRALSLQSEAGDGRGRKEAKVATGRCNGCGDCLTSCPRQALQLTTSPS